MGGMGKMYYVYILSSQRNGTLYVGVTNNLIRRVWEHKNGYYSGFTKRYNVHMLIYYESFDNPLLAIAREKQIKNWRRSWKIKLIEDKNSEWSDLYNSLE